MRTMRAGKSAALLTPLLLMAVILPVTARAVGIAGGFVEGPQDQTTINLTFLNDGLSSQDIVSIAIDGSTALAFPILWDGAGRRGNPPGATSSVVGENTQLLTISFGDDDDGFNPGESFSLTWMDPDGDPGPSSPQVQDLVGVQIRFWFRDETTWLGVLTLHQDPEQGLNLEVVPEPRSATLLTLGLALLALQRRSARSC